MKVWKIVGLVVLGIGALVGGIIYVAFQMTSGVVEAGDEFFAAARSGDYEAAYELTSQGIQREISLEELVQFIEFNSLDEVSDTSWSSRAVENNTGNIVGTLTTQTGGTIPIELTFVHEGEAWKINSIERQDTGFIDGNPAPATAPAQEYPVPGETADIGENVPPDIDLAVLLNENARGFVESIVDDDYLFWANDWVEGVNFIQLESRFPRPSALVEQLRPFMDTQAQLETARMIDGDRLELVGSLPGKGATLRMTQTFTQESKEWKLAEFAYEIE